MVTFSKELNHRPNRKGLFVVFLRIMENPKRTAPPSQCFTDP